ncbi:c6 transcription factor [Paramyrothecium foliicola]|nr:c6 transcription factor [Paramyrothecium foliicola]
MSATCTYSQNDHDKRLKRQATRKANHELRNKVPELEAQLVDAPRGAASQSASVIATQVGTETRPLENGAGFGGDMQTENGISEHTESESPIDVLAAGVFDHPSAGSSLCYFGPSSNHALFWSLTASIANLGYRSSRLYQEPLRSTQTNPGSSLPRPATSSITYYYNDSSSSSLPPRDIALGWISQFFETIGAVLPYIHEPALLDAFDKIAVLPKEQPWNRTTQALLSIVFAHALLTLEGNSAEPFYRRTLSLLDPKTLYTPNLELLQTLLLLGLYQQNSQRSTESWTTHALSVKSAYQLGVHAPSAYGHLKASEKELRACFWFAVVNEDRILSSALGQPFLISPQHVRKEIFTMLDSNRQQRTVETLYSEEGIAYFRKTILLHEIMGVAVDILCNSNIDLSSGSTIEELFPKTMELTLRLERWRQDVAPFSIITFGDLDSDSWSDSEFQAQRDSLLLSIFYHRTVLLVHGTLLTTTVETYSRHKSSASSSILQDNVISLLKIDFAAVTEFERLIRTILSKCPSFLRRHAIWWTCNYAALTTSLHLFNFWLASTNPKVKLIDTGYDKLELEARLRQCLETLQTIGSSSAMSVKAHRCLQRHLDFLSKTVATATDGPRRGGHSGQDISSQLQAIQSTSSDPFYLDKDSAYMRDTVEGLFEGQNLDFSQPDFLGLHFDVSDFDATGLI